MSRWWLAALLVLVTGCTASSGSQVGPGPTTPDPQRSALIARADLDPCPRSTAAPVDGGLPDITLPCLGRGPSVRLAGLRGPLVVNIWGAWCLPCQKEAPYFAQVHDELRRKVQVLGVDTEDTPGNALDFAPHTDPPMHYPSVVDDDKKVLLALDLASAVPSTVFVDAAGKVVHTSAGPYLDARSLRADIARYLGVGA